MDAEIGHDVLGVDQHVHEMRHRRALIAADIGHARLQQRLGDGQDAFAAKHLALAQAQRLNLFFERAFGHVSLQHLPHVARQIERQDRKYDQNNQAQNIRYNER